MTVAGGKSISELRKKTVKKKMFLYWQHVMAAGE